MIALLHRILFLKRNERYYYTDLIDAYHTIPQDLTSRNRIKISTVLPAHRLQGLESQGSLGRFNFGTLNIVLLLLFALADW